MGEDEVGRDVLVAMQTALVSRLDPIKRETDRLSEERDAQRIETAQRSASRTRSRLERPGRRKGRTS